MCFDNAALIRCFPLPRKDGQLLPQAVVKLVKHQRKGIESSKNVIPVVINGI